MPIRQRLVTYGVSTAAAATITAAVLLQPWRGAPTPDGRLTDVPTPVAQTAKHPVDVVFAVDTTGSMGGLLDGAKRTVWSIATHIRDADPDADVRIGLVAYRDLGDAYVTRDFPLTANLDAAFAELSSYRAEGGGDTPEDVDAALYDVVHKMRWRADARKLAFLVGDAAPASRGDVPRFDVSARDAAAQGIVINAIRCGWDRDTEGAWQQVAMLAHGQFSTIQQDGGVQQVATPYDDRLAALSDEIDRTAVIVGADGERAAHGEAMAAVAAAPAPAKADRATYYAKGKRGRAPADLVAGPTGGGAALEGVAPAALPPELRALSRDQLKAEIDRRATARAAAQKELEGLIQQRDEIERGADRPAHPQARRSSPPMLQRRRARARETCAVGCVLYNLPCASSRTVDPLSRRRHGLRSGGARGARAFLLAVEIKPVPRRD